MAKSDILETESVVPGRRGAEHAGPGGSLPGLPGAGGKGKGARGSVAIKPSQCHSTYLPPDHKLDWTAGSAGPYTCDSRRPGLRKNTDRAFHDWAALPRDSPSKAGSFKT